MRQYKPNTPYNVPLILLTPTYSRVKGTDQKTYPEPNLEAPEDTLFYGSFKTFGGTEMTENDLYTVINTATIETWYRPDIKAGCAVYVIETGKTYEIVGTPENIDMRNQFLKFKVRRVKGGA